MARIRLTWREANGDLPMVCPFCGDDAASLVTAEMKAICGRYRVIMTVHNVAQVTLPRCRRHRKSWTHAFTLHARWIEPDYVELGNAHRDFVDAVEDYREWLRDRRRRGRDRDDDRDDPPPRRRARRPASSSGSGWVVALVVVGVVGLTMIGSCLLLIPFVKFRGGAPPPNQQQWPGPPGPAPPRWR